MMIRRGTSHSFLTLWLASSFTILFVLTSSNTSSREEALERNKTLVLTMNDELWNKGKLDKMDEFFSTDMVRHFLLGGSELRGIDSLKEHEKKTP
jgi:hypothetical protein